MKTTRLFHAGWCGAGPRTVAVAPLVSMSTCALLLTAGLSAQPTKRQATFDSAGVTIHYQVEGEGDPVLLIHGYTATGDLNWRMPGVVSTLAPSYQVITLDNRGHGKSDKPEDPESYGLEMVRDQVRLLDHLGIDSAHVVGYSMGGMITLRMLSEHPERVRSAVIAGMGWTKADDATKARYRQGNYRGRPPRTAALGAVYRAFGDLGLTTDELREIETPMLLVVGSQDGLLESSVKPLLEVRPDVPLVTVEGGTHTDTPFKPAFKRALVEFLQQTESSQRGAAPTGRR